MNGIQLIDFAPVIKVRRDAQGKILSGLKNVLRWGAALLTCCSTTILSTGGRLSVNS